MERFVEGPVAGAVIWMALGAVASVVLLYIIGRIRTAPAQQELKTSELMSKFEDLHTRGELTDAEFRTIKTTLAVRLREELKDDDETG